MLAVHVWASFRAQKLHRTSDRARGHDGPRVHVLLAAFFRLAVTARLNVFVLISAFCLQLSRSSYGGTLPSLEPFWEPSPSPTSFSSGLNTAFCRFWQTCSSWQCQLPSCGATLHPSQAGEPGFPVNHQHSLACIVPCSGACSKHGHQCFQADC